ncbi:nicotinate-nucleotide adenylyltransferase [Halomonas koreensis]|uniref:Probable nicotinate-nucleotide adenylyltransferase n=1 Tax=Halomonas koreensis TaxID=245385 RepID=A0ABU1G3E1_9GAMM|nr:nicotinate-nucleotide adenylyltransferase [Halomonas koreensis]MDR5867078.1 nicotinate-nucleotide adenylyltransferase [Halomonas koreensis]
MLGGTFDPVHLGHLRSAVELREALGLDRVHMIPAARPPLRGEPRVTPEERLTLLRLGIGDTPGLVADPRELERDGPSYSADTLAELRAAYGVEARLVMALGHDAFLRLADWHAPERLFAEAHLVVVDRPDHEAALPEPLAELIAGREVEDAAALMAAPAGGLLRLRLPSRMAISATAVRRRLAEGRSVRYLLPEAVEARALALGLYRRGAEAGG